VEPGTPRRRREAWTTTRVVKRQWAHFGPRAADRPAVEDEAGATPPVSRTTPRPRVDLDRIVSLGQTEQPVRRRRGCRRQPPQPQATLRRTLAVLRPPRKVPGPPSPSAPHRRTARRPRRPCRSGSWSCPEEPGRPHDGLDRLGSRRPGWPGPVGGEQLRGDHVYPDVGALRGQDRGASSWKGSRTRCAQFTAVPGTRRPAVRDRRRPGPDGAALGSRGAIRVEGYRRHRHTAGPPGGHVGFSRWHHPTPPDSAATFDPLDTATRSEIERCWSGPSDRPATRPFPNPADWPGPARGQLVGLVLGPSDG